MKKNIFISLVFVFLGLFGFCRGMEQDTQTDLESTSEYMGLLSETARVQDDFLFRDRFGIDRDIYENNRLFYRRIKLEMASQVNENIKFALNAFYDWRKKVKEVYEKCIVPKSYCDEVVYGNIYSIPELRIENIILYKSYNFAISVNLAGEIAKCVLTGSGINFINGV